jgi:hypothetical protein
MADPFTWVAIASLAFTAFQGVTQASQARSDARSAEKAATAQNALAQEELTRQQGEANKKAQQEKSDRIRRADQELSLMRLAQSDAGAGWFSVARQVSDLGFVEGQDLSRIEANRMSSVEALQAEKRAAAQGSFNTITEAKNRASAAKTDAVMGTVASGLQIGTNYYGRKTATAKPTTTAYAPTSARRGSFGH